MAALEDIQGPGLASDNAGLYLPEASHGSAAVSAGAVAGGLAGLATLAGPSLEIPQGSKQLWCQHLAERRTPWSRGPEGLRSRPGSLRKGVRSDGEMLATVNPSKTIVREAQDEETPASTAPYPWAGASSRPAAPDRAAPWGGQPTRANEGL